MGGRSGRQRLAASVGPGGFREKPRAVGLWSGHPEGRGTEGAGRTHTAHSCPMPRTQTCESAVPSVHLPLAVKSRHVQTPMENGGIPHLGSTEKAGVCNPQRCPQMSQDLPAPGRGPEFSGPGREPKCLQMWTKAHWRPQAQRMVSPSPGSASR